MSTQPEGAPQQFHFVDVERKKAVPVERRIHSVWSAKEVDIQKTAGQLIDLVSADRRGAFREPEAALQNRITRAIYARVIPNKNTFFSDFKNAVNAVADKKDKREVYDLNEDTGTFERVPVGLFAARYERGIRAVVEAIAELERSFVRSTRPADLQQMIGMNDFLDAADKIDLVDLRYQPRKSATDIRAVRLVQVKVGGIPLQADEIARIQQAHKNFVDRIFTQTAYEQHVRGKAEDYILSGKVFGERLRQARDRAAVDQLFIEYFEEFIFEVAHAVPSSPAQVEAVMQAHRSNISPTVAKTFFGKSSARGLIIAISNAYNLTGEQTAQLVDVTNAWATESVPTTSQLVTMNPDAPSLPEMLSAATFESVILDGTRTLSIPLATNAAEPRVLTRK